MMGDLVASPPLMENTCSTNIIKSYNSEAVWTFVFQDVLNSNNVLLYLTRLYYYV